MASFRVEWRASAAKELRKIDRQAIPRIVEAAEQLACEPLPPGAKPGDILGLLECHIGVACADAVYFIPTVVPAGKRPMDAKAFSCGYLGKCDDDAMAVCGPPESGGAA